MCSIWKKDQLHDELTAQEIGQFLKRFHNLSWLNLTGGEIFLRDDLPNIFGLIKESCKGLFLLNFGTNGSQPELIYETVRDALLLGFPKVLVTVSLDGPEAIHDRIRGVAGSWRKAIDTYSRLRTLKGGNFDLFFGYTLQEANAGVFTATLKTANDVLGGLTSNDFHLNIVHRSGHFYDNTASLGQGASQTLWAELQTIMNMRHKGYMNPVSFLESRYQGLAKRYLSGGNGLTPVPCEALSASLFMDPSGNVFPCTIYNRPLGNIRQFDYDIEGIWRTEERLHARRSIKAGECPGCWTPCEAYQSILANLPRAVISAF